MKPSKLHPDFFQSGGYSPIQLSNSQFIPTYAGAPLAEGDKYGEGLAKLYHQNISDLTRLDLLNASRKVKPGDEEVSQAYDKQLADEMAKMAKEGNYEDMTVRINALARNHVNNPDLKALAESRAEYEKQEEDVRKLGLSKQQALNVQDPAKFQTITYDENGKKIVNIFKNKVQGKLDWDEKIQNIWNAVKEDAGPLSQAQADKLIPAIQGYINTGVWTGITDNKILAKLQDAVKVYEGSSEGVQQQDQFIQEAEQLGIEDPKEQKAYADAKIREFALSAGRLKTFSKTDPQLVQDLVFAEALRNSGKDTSSAFLPGTDTGVRTDAPIVKLTEVQTPDDLIAKAESSYMKGLNINNKFYTADQLKKLKLEDKVVQSIGTPEEQQNHLRIAKAALEWKYSQDKKAAAGNGVEAPTHPLKQFYEGNDPAKAEKAEKDFLFSNSTNNIIKEFQDHMNERMSFAFKQDYNYSSPEGRNQAAGDLEDFKNRWAFRTFYNLDTGEVFSAKDGESFNEKFTEAIPDVSKVTVGGTTGLANPYAMITGKPEFNDAVYLNYADKDGKVSRLLMAKDPRLQDYNKRIISDLWTSGIQNSYSTVTKELSNGTDKIKFSYEDKGDEGILLKTVGNKTVNTMLGANDYTNLFIAVKSVSGLE